MTQRNLLPLLAFAVLLATTGCTAEGDPLFVGKEVAGTEPIGDLVDFAAHMLPLLGSRCEGCHIPEPLGLGGLKLWSHEKVLAGGLNNGDHPAVVPCKPDESLLYLKLSQDTPPVGARMPLGRDPLPSGEVALIRRWISEGATATPTAGVCEETGGSSGADAAGGPG